MWEFTECEEALNASCASLGSVTAGTATPIPTTTTEFMYGQTTVMSYPYDIRVPRDIQIGIEKLALNMAIVSEMDNEVKF